MKFESYKYLALLAFILSQDGLGTPSSNTDLSLLSFPVRYECGESLKLWGEEGAETWIATACARLKPTYLKLKSHSIFRDALSKPVAVLLVSRWDKGVGFAAEHLQSPDGTRAVLLRADVAFHEMQGPSVLVHELTHLVHLHARSHEEGWIREGLALLLERIVTERLNPLTPLAWNPWKVSLFAGLDAGEDNFQFDAPTSQQYGLLSAFFIYAHRVCGNGRKDWIQNLLTEKNNLKGIPFLNWILGQQHSVFPCQNFKELFDAFVIARFAPTPRPPWGHVFPGKWPSGETESCPRKLPPGAAMIYSLESPHCNLKKCATGDKPWGREHCLRVKYIP